MVRGCRYCILVIERTETVPTSLSNLSYLLLSISFGKRLQIFIMHEAIALMHYCVKYNTKMNLKNVVCLSVFYIYATAQICDNSGKRHLFLAIKDENWRFMRKVKFIWKSGF